MREREEKRKVDREKRTSVKRDREIQRERERGRCVYLSSSLLYSTLLYSSLDLYEFITYSHH